MISNTFLHIIIKMSSADIDNNTIDEKQFEIRPTNDQHSQLFKVSDELIQITSVLQNNICCGVYNENIKNKLTKCNFSQHEQLFNFLLDQNSVKNIDPTYSIYKANLFTNEVSHYCDICEEIKDGYYTRIEANDKYLFLNCLSVDSLCVFLFDNTREFNRYVFIPVSMTSEIYEKGHYSIIIFDIIEKLVYFADPNGKTSFFNNIFYTYSRMCPKKEKCNDAIVDNSIKPNQDNLDYSMLEDMYIDSEDLIEKMFELYIENFNITTGSCFKFVKRNTWNQNGNTINKTYNGSVVGSGHCLALGVLIANYCHIKKCVPNEIYELFSKLSTSEIIELINSYSIGLYNIMIYIE